ncbi:hypothetical protein SAMN05661010_02131 [Modicisalibacter muralis]|uniref:Uncharacterized protein n=1 Tax=Modicisalibacter muralis TaxID=119000 RepID=A0A1G9LKH3_9GAMM|nr:hypothetical protein SAMN05661010_02131 [Halomonas muralis]
MAFLDIDGRSVAYRDTGLGILFGQVELDHGRFGYHEASVAGPGRRG